MKKYLIYLLVMLISFHFSAQETTNIRKQIRKKEILNPATGQFEYDTHFIKKIETQQMRVDFELICNEKFWTVNEAGEIQEWSLYNGLVSGGQTILTGAGKSLAVCGDISSPTFYCSNYPATGITYYDEFDGWTSITTDSPLLNNGGYGTDQYYMGTVVDPDLGFDVNRVLYHYDGTLLETIEELESDYFAVADIAVDGLGRAWVFKGPNFSEVTSLEVYNSSGFLMSFDITFNSFGAYGSFFLNDTLYIGIGFDFVDINPQSIIPIVINGQNAMLGTPIAFPNNQPYFSDLASCHDSNPLSINEVEIYENEFVVIPNPTRDIVNIPDYIDIISVEIINLNGQLIRTINNGGSISLAGLTNGMYILKILTKNWTVNKKVIKE